MPFYHSIWHDVGSRIVSLPECLKDEILFSLPYTDSPYKGTEFTIKTRKASVIYIAQQEGEKCGWSQTSLLANGWTELLAFVEVDWTQLKLWSKKVEENEITTIPATTTEETAAAIFVAEGEHLY